MALTSESEGFRPDRGRCSTLGGGALLAATGMRHANAQDYPTRPVQVLVPFAGGSASDVITRILLNRMSMSLGQAFVVDNRPGAGGNTAPRLRRMPHPTATRSL